MSPYEWTQSHMVYLPHGFTVDRRCNRDKQYVIVKKTDTGEKLRAELKQNYPGLIPLHDTLVYLDFNRDIKDELEYMITRHRLHIKKLYIEREYCPSTKVSFRCCGCSWCLELSNRAPKGSFKMNIHLYHVSRFVYRNHWIEPEPRPDNQGDTDQVESSESTDEDQDDEEKEEIPADTVNQSEEVLHSQSQQSQTSVSTTQLNSMLDDIFGDSDDDDNTPAKRVHAISTRAEDVEVIVLDSESDEEK